MDVRGPGRDGGDSVSSLSPQTCQRDIKKLKANEMKLQQDMTSASREITRLRALVKDFGTELSAV